MRKTERVVLAYHLTNAIAERFWAKVDRSGGPDACWPWRGSDRAGYGRFKLASYVTVTASRLAYALHHQSDPGPMLVCHSCDNPPCCNPAHLFPGTVKDNSIDMVAKGRGFVPPSAGEQNGRAKLTAEQIEMVKDLIRRGRNNKQIARVFGVTHQLISRIRRGKAWGTEPMQPRYASLRR